MEVNKKRSEGGAGLPVVECINSRLQKYRVRCDFKTSVDEEGNERGVTFIEKEYNHRPSLAEVKEFVISVINEKTDERILSGFVWSGKSVWLSQENQRNFSEAHRMAGAAPEAVLPVTFKIGEQQDGTPVYHTFATFDELNDFYVSAFAFINQCLQEGWAEKDSIDWTPYEELTGE